MSDDLNPLSGRRAVGEAISSLENSFRDLISRVMEQAHGRTWFDHLGVTPERIASWQERREEEPKRRPGGSVEQRLLYYSEFHDLPVIIRKNWQHGFRDCFRDQTRFRVYMDRLSAYRNPDAHSRALLPFEEQLAVGMAGQLRQEITMFLSSGGGGSEPEHFARIEEVTDNFGNRNISAATGGKSGVNIPEPMVILRPGDKVSFKGTAWDPDGGALRWNISVGGQRLTLSGSSVEWEWLVQPSDIGEPAYVSITLHSEDREYARHAGSDDFLQIFYRVLPSRR